MQFHDYRTHYQQIPRIRFRRGSVVHRKRLASVPTGFLDKEIE